MLQTREGDGEYIISINKWNQYVDENVYEQKNVVS